MATVTIDKGLCGRYVRVATKPLLRTQAVVSIQYSRPLITSGQDIRKNHLEKEKSSLENTMRYANHTFVCTH